MSKDTRIINKHLLRPRKEFREFLSNLISRLSKIKDNCRLSNSNRVFVNSRLSFFLYRLIKIIRKTKERYTDSHPASFAFLLLEIILIVNPKAINKHDINSSNDIDSIYNDIFNEIYSYNP